MINSFMFFFFDNKIEWIIPNFKQYFCSEKTTRLHLLTHEEVKKEDCQKKEKQALALKIQFSGINNNICDVLLMSHNFENNQPTLIYNLSIYYNNDNNLSSNVGKEDAEVPRKKWQYITTLYKSDYDKNNRDGSLKLIFEYTFKTIINNCQHVLDYEKQNCNEFMRLLSDDQFSDIVTIKSVEGNEYKVHKAVLKDKSEVMKAHFEHAMMEKQTNIMESPLEDKVLKDIITFIYCNKAPSFKDIPEKLLAAADYYQLSELKMLCEEELCEKLCVENAIDTFMLADLYSASILKQCTLEFMKHEAHLIIRTEGWATLNSPEVLKAFCANILDSNIKSIEPFI